MRMKKDDFGVKLEPILRKTQLTLHVNVSYVDRQCKLSCSAT